jgi:serine/threonine protein kinase
MIILSTRADIVKPNIFATPDAGTPDPTISNVGRYVREWRGGPKYNKITTIGKGAFATVYKITAKFDGVPFAAKELEKRRFMKNGILDQKVDNEMKIMKRIKHVGTPLQLMNIANICSPMLFSTLNTMTGRSISILSWSTSPAEILAL